MKHQTKLETTTQDRTAKLLKRQQKIMMNKRKQAKTQQVQTTSKQAYSFKKGQ